jgi:glyoxylase-like metal-dependent hydrolase (beta-lactamase superfamily II)
VFPGRAALQRSHHKETKVTATVVQINAGQVNVFLLRGESGNVLVDAGNPGGEGRILSQLVAHGVTPDALRLILITHGHLDHFGSAAALREQSGAPVAVHALDADALRQGVHQPGSLEPTSRLVGYVMRAVQKFAAAGPSVGFEPDIVFADPFRLDEYGVAGRVIPTPGHTPGSVSVLLDGGDLVLGDSVMGRMLGLIRRPGPPLVAWDLAQNWDNVRRLAALRPRRIYAGHGGPFETAEVDELLARVSYE